MIVILDLFEAHATHKAGWAGDVGPPAYQLGGFLSTSPPANEKTSASQQQTRQSGTSDGAGHSPHGVIETRYEADIRVASPSRKASAEYRPSVHVGVQEEGIWLLCGRKRDDRHQQVALSGIVEERREQVEIQPTIGNRWEPSVENLGQGIGKTRGNIGGKSAHLEDGRRKIDIEIARHGRAGRSGRIIERDFVDVY